MSEKKFGMMMYLCWFLIIRFFVLCNSRPVETDNGSNLVKYCDDKCIGERDSLHYETDDKLMIDGANKDAVDLGFEEREGDETEGEEGEYFEGDIVLGDEYILDPAEYTEDNEVFKNVVLRDSKIWPNKVVFFNFSSEFNSTQRQKVEDAIDDLHNVSCVRFVPRTNEPTYLYFRNKKKSCSAPVGWNPARGRIDVSLGGRNCLARRGTVQHELLHALGFWHEHSRTDRDSNILINWNNILEGREKNFKVRMANESATLGIPYDFESVMHYRNNSFSREKKRLATIVPRNPQLKVYMGQRIRVSESDIAKLNRLYRCDRFEYNMGNNIPGAMHWDTFRETILNEKPIYFNKLPEPEPLEFEENSFLLTGIKRV